MLVAVSSSNFWFLLCMVYIYQERGSHKLPSCIFFGRIGHETSNNDGLFWSNSLWCWHGLWDVQISAKADQDFMDMGVSKSRGTWKWMVYSGKSYFSMDDLGVPLFLEILILLLRIERLEKTVSQNLREGTARSIWRYMKYVIRLMAEILHHPGCIKPCK